MKLTIFNNQKFLMAFLVFSLFISNYYNRLYQKPKITISKQSSAINFNNDLVQFFSLGNKRLFSSIIWITTLLESDLDHYKGKDFNSWLYLRFNTISHLDPLFLANYTFGGQYLSIIKDDIAGAEVILLRGLDKYPENYYLLFSLAFLYVFEKQDFKKGLVFYKKIRHYKQAPKNIESFIHKLEFYNSGMDLELTFESVLLTYNHTTDPYLKEKLAYDLYSLRAQIDLDCLNLKQNNCNLKDLDGEFYIKKGQQFVAPKPFKPYKIFLKN